MATMTTSDTGRPSEAHRRQAVINAAARLFDEVGFHNADTALIAERAGLSKAEVYEVFRAKHDILYAIHDQWIDDLLKMARENADRTLDGPDGVRRAIRQHILDILFVIHSRPSQVRVYFQNFRDLPPDLQKLAKAKRDIYEAQVEGVIRLGIETGVFRTQNARVATLGLFGMCNWGYQWYRAGGDVQHQQIAQQLGDIFLRGMAVEPIGLSDRA
jgi:AcrR family transcriptional regulator